MSPAARDPLAVLRGSLAIALIAASIAVPATILLCRGGLWSATDLRDYRGDSYRYSWSMFATMEGVTSRYAWRVRGSGAVLTADARDTLGRITGRMLYAEPILRRLCVRHPEAEAIIYRGEETRC